MILVNNPGCWAHLVPPLGHPGWNGCTPTELVFPFFLFAAQGTRAVLPGLREGGTPASLRRVATRVSVLLAIGLLLNASPFVPRALAVLRWPDALRADGSVVWTSPLPWLNQPVFAGIGSDPRLGSFLFACAHVALYAALALWLDRRRLYFRV